MAAKSASLLASPCDDLKETDHESVWRTKDVKSWTDEEVEKWLCSIGFEEEAALFSNEKITSEALATIEKSDVKELGVQPMGRRITLMAKINELFNTPKQDKHSDVVHKSESVTLPKKKVTAEDKKLWDAKSKTAYLEKTSFIVREAAKVWPGNKKVHFKNNQTEALKLEELVSRLEQTCQIPKIGFGRECIRNHILQWTHEKNHRLSDGYDYEAEKRPAKRAKRVVIPIDSTSGDESTSTEQELDLGPVEEQESCEKSEDLKDLSVQSAVLIIMCCFDVLSMQSIILKKHLYPLAKKLQVKHRSLGKYAMCVPLSTALITNGHVKVIPAESEGQVNFIRLKRENIVVIKSVENDGCSTPPQSAFDGDEGGDTDSVSSESTSP